ncbi:hypothetical protein BpHYR1_041372 [Brachionus plicatilis]|uniref:Uncharacterized protein n=1 Tax=Brachionus plicatilis TaxID=10195 RepID=A0A3M7SLY9_BRAPC|nr:hypothetical protein BpHYR1_041372 [Brachionus plicatilis]
MFVLSISNYVSSKKQNDLQSLKCRALFFPEIVCLIRFSAKMPKINIIFFQKLNLIFLNHTFKIRGA